jgi:hypothetical protein
MNFGICNLSVIAVRKLPEHGSEMVTQLLFGESFDIIETENSWVFINTHYENYKGWIHQLQFLPLDGFEFNEFKGKPMVLTPNSSSSLTEVTSKKYVHLLLGCTLPLPIGDKFTIESVDYIFKGEYFTPSGKKTDILKFAACYQNAPYLWGGRTQFGIDCSGFTQMAYKLAGIFLPRDASQQSEIGETLSFISESEPGDLVFFDNETGNITHVGIIYDHQHIIHASGCVRIDMIDHNGIYNKDLGKYTHQLRLIKKVVA